METLLLNCVLPFTTVTLPQKTIASIPHSFLSTKQPSVTTATLSRTTFHIYSSVNRPTNIRPIRRVPSFSLFCLPLSTPLPTAATYLFSFPTRGVFFWFYLTLLCWWRVEGFVFLCFTYCCTSVYNLKYGTACRGRFSHR